MANWVVAVDEDAGRREAFGSRAAQSVAPFEGLSVATRTGSNWVLAWAVAANAPVDVHSAPGRQTVCFGEPRDANGALQTAATIEAAWRGGEAAQWDGFYAALSLDEAERSLTVGTDVLGIFPVYHWADHRGTVLVGTSPELFRAHPNFSPALNPAGLVGILLTNGLVDGETLWQGVKRLAPGHRLRVVDGRLREEECYRFPADAESADLPLEGHVEILADVVASAVRRHVPAGRDYGLLLSGGLDSRILTGYLTAQHARVRALTLGLPSDVELRCARRVATHARFPHAHAEIPADAYPAAAQALARWESLSNGFGGVIEWAAKPHLSHVGDRVITGHVMDGVIGGLHLHWAYDDVARRMSFDKLFTMVNQWGLSPATLTALLQPRHAELVHERVDRARAIHDGHAASAHHRAWLFDMQHRMRFHVGGALWPLSFSAWPVLPVLDRSVIAAAATLPCSSLARRRAQTELLLTRFPDLARLPLDRNSFDSRPLIPSASSEILHHVSSRALRLGARLHRVVNRPTPEPLYYRRIFDLNTSGWRRVRRIAMANDAGLLEFFRPDALAAQLPGSEVPLDMSSAISRRGGMLLLIGLQLVLQQSARQH